MSSHEYQTNHFPLPWDSSQLLNLPYSKRVDVSVLNRIFANTSASYKYLFFLSLLDILMDDGFKNADISLDRILLDMLVKAWFPHNYFRLSFGVADQIPVVLDKLIITPPANGSLFGTGGRQALRDAISSSAYMKNNLLGMVPYRLLTPFFEKELQELSNAGKLKDHNKNKYIVELANSRFQKNKPFYCFSEDRKTIVLNHDWMLYFYENFTVIKAVARLNLLDYMQKRNPSVPNIKIKIFPPVSRDPLTRQTKYWRHILEHRSLNCLFSGQPLSLDDLSIDHFLPWSFVAHDQLWNMVPVARGINSSKSNNLPSFDKYLDGFINMQFEGLKTYSETVSSQKWKKVIEPYQIDLHMGESEILNRSALAKHLKKTMEPLRGLATAQGFSPDWVYSA